MIEAQELHVIFGTGPVGKAIMRRLTADGKPVRIVNRRGQAQAPASVEVVKGDAANPSSAQEACAGAAVVYNCANPPYDKWPELFPPIQAGIIEGAASAGAKLVSTENVYMYGEVDSPITEDMPYAATTKKGQVRARMAEDLMAAHQAGKVQAVSGRASDYYGPGGLNTALGFCTFYPALAGETVRTVGDADAPHTYTFVDDFAAGLVTLGERDEALGQAWHIPSAPTITTREIVTMAFAEAGNEPKISSTPKLMLRGLSLFDKDIRELMEMLYEFEKPFIVDHSKYEQAFGNQSTPHDVAIHSTVEWFRANPQQ